MEKVYKRKIDLLVYCGVSNQWVYYGTTMQSKTCKAAKERFLMKHPHIQPSMVKAEFVK